ncbi:MAG: response regulator [Bacteroidales bacterium]|nr:response regulator [Bacteroidales bacterium]
MAKKPTLDELNKELEALRESNEQLKNRIADLKRQKDSDDAQEFDRKSRREYLGMMSHDIRTPLNAIVGMASLLSDTKLTEEQQELLDTIRVSVNHLTNIVNELIDLSKIENNKLRLKEEPFKIKECVEDAIDIANAYAKEKGVELLYSIEQGVSKYLKGDTARLRQVVVEMFKHIMNYIDSGSIMITVEKIGEAKGIQRIKFSFSDSSTGFSKQKIQQLERAFEEMNSLEHSQFSTRDLSLAVIQALIRLMNGEMGVESPQKDQFALYFTAQMARSEAGNAGVQFRGQIPELKNERVLIVDDNQTNRHILTLQFESWGMIPVTAESGKAALDMLAEPQEKFSLAIVDMQMPEMDGIELAKAIKKHPEKGNTPVVMLTSMEFTHELPSEIFKATLMKPVQLAELFEVVLKTIYEQKLKAKKEDDHKVDRKLAEKIPLNIMVAEDNDTNRKLADKLMKRMGYNATIVSNGKEVIEELENNNYDIIFMDIQMPVMDGLQATDEIFERWDESERPKIIAMTAYAMPEDQEKYLEKGMVDVIAKPIRFKQVQELLGKWGQLDSLDEGNREK